MSYSVSVEDFDSLAPSWSKLLLECPACPIFFTPEWQRTWWRHFGKGEPLLLAVRYGGRLAGVAPLMRDAGGLSLLGSSNVCDYLDFIAPVEQARAVCAAVADYIASLEWEKLRLFSLRDDSAVRVHFLPVAARMGWAARQEQEDVSPQRELPATWEEYLSLLDRRGRHELRRKMRRLNAEPGVACETVARPDNIDKDMDDFLRLFLDSREAKVEFLTPEMSAFFRDMARMAVSNGWLKLFFLSIGGARSATAMTFDIGETLYLYNSGYDKRLAHLSVGLLLKAQCIEAAIAAGKRRFDFLRGREHYKYDLGGIDRPVYRCEITRDVAVPVHGDRT